MSSRAIFPRAAFLCVLASGVLFAGAALGKDGPTVEPVATTQVAAGSPFEVVIPYLGVEAGTKLEDYLRYLRSVSPSLNVVVVGAPDVESNLSLPRVQLKGVTVGESLYMLQQVFPGQIEIVSGSANEDRITYVNVTRNGNAPLPLRTDIYPLRAVIESLARDNQPAGNAADAQPDRVRVDILSMITTALDQTRSSEPPATLKFHDATQTLIATGSPNQLKVVQQALAALSTGPDERVARQTNDALDKLNRERRELELMLDRADSDSAKRSAEIDAREKTILELTREVERLKVRLEQAIEVQQEYLKSRNVSASPDQLRKMLPPPTTMP